ncbi:SGS-domain-containing protein [Polychaeton citri CBS 116435]|uniref:SGS-domain-containing protein n=1 Tax=Polychaeton citri CBS 116435 TaxID=1314669 RepID=A0A9P4QHS9_9PEZI|nr:SGS-domain-containing protein [Polychaeton citri CBS 116435]
MDSAARGAKALATGDLETAISEYTAAIKSSPTSPDYHAKRSQAYQRSGKNEEALKDAEKAVVLAQKRAKRESIIDAQYKRAVALYNLGRYADAAFVADVVKKMDEKNKLVDVLKGRALSGIGKLADGDENKLVRVTEIPVPEDESLMRETKTPNGGGHITTATQPQLLQQTPADKIRHEWYQNSDNVYFTLLAKGVPQEKAVIDITSTSLSISFPLVATSSSYDFTLEPLFATVVPEKSTKRILSTKIEVILAKASSGQKWGALEGDHHPSTDAAQASPDKDDSVKQAVLSASSNASIKPAAGHSYPTSSRTGPKNWDSIKLEGDEDKGGDEANDFFKMLYSQASPETRRAMIKSYTESNGTALSTNWEEVSQGKVETTPPDGMEAKQYSK